MNSGGPNGEFKERRSVAMRKSQKRLVPIGLGSAACYLGLVGLAVAGHTDADGLTLLATLGVIYLGCGAAAYHTMGRMASQMERQERGSTPGNSTPRTSQLAETNQAFRRWRNRFALLLASVWVPLTLAAAALPRFVRLSVILVAILLYPGLAAGCYQAHRWEKRTRPGRAVADG